MEEKLHGKTAAKKDVQRARRIMIINPSKHETSNRKHVNKNYWKNIVSQLENSAKQPGGEAMSADLNEVLPAELYREVCRTLELPAVDPPPTTVLHHHRQKKPSRPHSKHSVKMPLLSYRKSFIVERDLESDTEVEVSPRIRRNRAVETEQRLHQEFLSRGIREQVTWPSRYLAPEREDEKGLVKKANDLTDKIAEEFCEYMRQLGGTQPSPLFTPEAIKALFQVEFDNHATRSLRIISRELGAVPNAVAKATGLPERSKDYILQRLIEQDMRAERSPDRLTAFGRSVPAHDQWRAPRRDTRRLWRTAGHVPRDLVTLKTVWDGITNLRSVKEYCRWLINNPELRRPPFLKSMGMFNQTTLNARITVESTRSANQCPDRSEDPWARSDDTSQHDRRPTSQSGDRSNGAKTAPPIGEIAESVRKTRRSGVEPDILMDHHDSLDAAPINEIRRVLTELAVDD